ncbi:hypothetical protein BX600DRAFT_445013 [Xylariales sp. PMI_506]|nr:hypothetical protein BX600DRAFT_445013 [Xylariales sp. PMI_506]
MSGGLAVRNPTSRMQTFSTSAASVRCMVEWQGDPTAKASRCRSSKPTSTPPQVRHRGLRRQPCAGPYARCLPRSARSRGGDPAGSPWSSSRRTRVTGGRRRSPCGRGLPPRRCRGHPPLPRRRSRPAPARAAAQGPPPASSGGTARRVRSRAAASGPRGRRSARRSARRCRRSASAGAAAPG